MSLLKKARKLSNNGLWRKRNNFVGYDYLSLILPAKIIWIFFDRKIEVNSWIIKSRWFYVGGVLLIGFLTRVVELKKKIDIISKPR